MPPSHLSTHLKANEPEFQRSYPAAYHELQSHDRHDYRSLLAEQMFHEYKALEAARLLASYGMSTNQSSFPLIGARSSPRPPPRTAHAWAAITIQRVWRGYKGRRYCCALVEEKQRVEEWEKWELSVVTQATITIQRVWRGILARDRVLAMLVERRRVYESLPSRMATRIQHGWRVYTGRKLRKAKWKEREQEIAELQQKAALTLQRVQRGHFVRQTARVIRNRKQRQWDLIHASAATEIQRVWKGYWQRQRFLVQRTHAHTHQRQARLLASCLLQRVWRGALGRTKATARRRQIDRKEQQIYHVAALTIQCMYRCYKAKTRVWDLALHRYATRIQAFWRGCLARAQSATMQKQSNLEKELNRRLAVFQATFRGQQHRKKLNRSVEFLRTHFSSLHALLRQYTHERLAQIETQFAQKQALFEVYRRDETANHALLLRHCALQHSSPLFQPIQHQHQPANAKPLPRASSFSSTDPRPQRAESLRELRPSKDRKLSDEQKADMTAWLHRPVVRALPTPLRHEQARLSQSHHTSTLQRSLIHSAPGRLSLASSLPPVRTAQPKRGKV
eukprot:NODE_865_length_1805_cov_26.202026_g809_i0.p1 GENE.NODE_865_length_1805_cov_26.202026_g809_i0~~NODE_865_length_1805_cov_26.202026_g809_i0.p1  ORF type:complete len:564 (-),score=111.13 NODE_865_length_1805_cov_26.202026_g809_i0:88-1779(-)